MAPLEIVFRAGISAMSLYSELAHSGAHRFFWPLVWAVLVLFLVALVIIYFSWFCGGWAAVRCAKRSRVPSPSMAGKVVVVTGGNAGIGLGVVRELSRAGAAVVLCSRTEQRGIDAKASLHDLAEHVDVMQLDLGSLSSIQAFAKAFRRKYTKLDVLVLNAGVAQSFLGNQGFRLTADGFEEMMGVNFLGHFHLTQLLLPVLRQTPGARVIAHSSFAAANSYSQGIDTRTWKVRSSEFQDWKQYGQSKLALVLFMAQLHRREPSILCLGCHPGVVAGTTLMHERGGLLERPYSWFIFRLLAMRAEDGWRNSLYLATTSDTLQSGGFYHPVGRLMSWVAHRLARAAALQAPVRMNIDHDDLWDKAEAALKEASIRISGSTM
eukprot:gnl/TRDRNA2_/TRDRNA2_135687_c0_seq2.p1 gnl/TRDRNA2_/TRDRNA2_135687_c0~~gnl/TRDRNA2_/TRDRNA2_135687_c0_seq2.p1  ORF type:complete len:380 (+),score=48.81 gnl/TRDRNA2_/TRDRNA2_135687_c0_seq2:413-1552(+)